MIFSKRYAAAIRNGKLEVALPDALRQKIAETMAMHNHAIGVRRNPDDPWIDHTRT